MVKHSTLAAGLVALAAVALIVPAVAAHVHPRRHHHGHRTAVIIVGKPTPVRRALIFNGRPHGVLDLNVKPKKTEVWTDGKYRGTCDAFDGYPNKLYLLPGVHRIKLVTPDGLEVAREVHVRAGLEINVGLDLR